MKNPERLIKEILRPLLPLPTDFPETLTPPAGIRAVLFDIYGTLLVSGVGEIGLVSTENHASIIEKIFLSMDISPLKESSGTRALSLLRDFIEKEHRKLRAEGIDYPEVEIRAVWFDVLETLRKDGYIPQQTAGILPADLALQYELLINPVWPMPGFPHIVKELHNAGFKIGIVSNAQFYTPLIVETLIGEPLESMGFEKDFCAWSWEKRRGKPSAELFADPLEKLEMHGIRPEQILFVGNDRLNDISAGAQAGCRTCLFAGDSRSLRLRKDDSRADASPDMTIRHLQRLETLIELL